MAHVGHERVELVLNHLLCIQGTAPSVLITQREIAAALGLSQPVISHALQMLRDTGRLRRNVDRSWSVSETPVYDRGDGMERRIADHISMQLLEELKELRKEMHELRSTPVSPALQTDWEKIDAHGDE